MTPFTWLFCSNYKNTGKYNQSMDNNSGKLMDNAENYYNKNVDVYCMYKNKGKITVYLRWRETLNLDTFNS